MNMSHLGLFGVGTILASAVLALLFDEHWIGWIGGGTGALICMVQGGRELLGLHDSDSRGERRDR